MTVAVPPPAVQNLNQNPEQNLGQGRRWHATLRLGFCAGADRTRLRDMNFSGPLRVQRPFYPEGEVCHSYLLHPPGGLVSGDLLQLGVSCEPGSHALLTTPSAGKIYRADSCGVAQVQEIRIQVNSASCEWLPMETVVFDGANGRLDTRIDLSGSARFIGMDVVCLGRPASQLPFVQGQIEQRLSVYRDQRPLLLDRLLLGGDQALLHASPGFQGRPVAGTLVAAGLDDPQAAVELLRQQLPALDTGLFSLTQRLGVLIARYLGDDSETAIRQLRLVWYLLRPLLWQRPACVPRIWAT